MDFSAISFLGSLLNCLFSSSFTLIAKVLELVTSIAAAISSCSACERRSAATYIGFAESSATISISLGPAIISISTKPYTIFLANATNMFPGPTILSTFEIVLVP